jgi:hypothetical protein
LKILHYILPLSLLHYNSFEVSISQPVENVGKLCEHMEHIAHSTSTFALGKKLKKVTQKEEIKK